MTSKTLSRAFAAAALLAAAASTNAFAQAAVPQTWQKVENGNVQTEIYGYLDPRSCVVFMAPDLVTTKYKTWYERWVLVPSGHYEDVAKTLASKLTVGGVTGWRIPSLSEVESYKLVQPYLHAGTIQVGTAYWSTDTLGTQVHVWRPAANTTRTARSGVNAYLWPVRDAEDCKGLNDPGTKR